jgi:hypothetical protein
LQEINKEADEQVQQVEQDGTADFAAMIKWWEVGEGFKKCAACMACCHWLIFAVPLIAVWSDPRGPVRDLQQGDFAT